MFTGSPFAPLSRDCLVVPDVSPVTVVPGSPEETQAMVGISCAHFGSPLSSLVVRSDECGRISCFSVSLLHSCLQYSVLGGSMPAPPTLCSLLVTSASLDRQCSSPAEPENHRVPMLGTKLGSSARTVTILNH